jgi:hypothetical protein
LAEDRPAFGWVTGSQQGACEHRTAQWLPHVGTHGPGKASAGGGVPIWFRPGALTPGRDRQTGAGDRFACLLRGRGKPGPGGGAKPGGYGIHGLRSCLAVTPTSRLLLGQHTLTPRGQDLAP